MAPGPTPLGQFRVPSIIVHGGAGADPGEGREDVMRAAVNAGWTVLREGGHSLDAVERAVRVLEDHPRFNAGRGSVLTAVATVEIDASPLRSEPAVPF